MHLNFVLIILCWWLRCRCEPSMTTKWPLSANGCKLSRSYTVMCSCRMVSYMFYKIIAGIPHKHLRIRLLIWLLFHAPSQYAFDLLLPPIVKLLFEEFNNGIKIRFTEHSFRAINNLDRQLMQMARKQVWRDSKYKDGRIGGALRVMLNSFNSSLSSVLSPVWWDSNFGRDSFGAILSANTKLDMRSHLETPSLSISRRQLLSTFRLLLIFQHLISHRNERQSQFFFY